MFATPTSSPMKRPQTAPLSSPFGDDTSSSNNNIITTPISTKKYTKQRLKYGDKSRHRGTYFGTYSQDQANEVKELKRSESNNLFNRRKREKRSLLPYLRLRVAKMVSSDHDNDIITINQSRRNVMTHFLDVHNELSDFSKVQREKVMEGGRPYNLKKFINNF